MDHLWNLSAHGVAWPEVSAKSGVPLNTLYNMSYKHNHNPNGGKIHRNYAERIMAIQIPEGSTTHDERVIGSKRILRGLNYRGWTMEFVAAKLGTTSGSLKAFSAEAPTIRRGMSHELYSELVQLAGQLESKDPLDHIARRQAMNVSSRAKNKGWYDISAWDFETVHEANAKPDETGKCGQVGGILIHMRENQRVCPRCEQVRESTRLDVDAFFAAVSQGTLTANKDIAHAFDISEQLASKYAGLALGTTRRDTWHVLTEIDETNMRAYCSVCNDKVQIYRSGRSDGNRLKVGYSCKNKVVEYREKHGHNHGNGRIDFADKRVRRLAKIEVEDIREKYESGKFTGTELAKMYNVSHSTIYRVVNLEGGYK